MGALKDSILGKLEAIDWSILEVDEYRDASLDAIAEGTFEYCNDYAANATIVCVATGAYTTPAAPVPYVAPVDLTLVLPPASSLVTQLKLNLVPGSTVANYFVALATWLAVPVIVTNVTGWADPLVPPVTPADVATGVGTTLFPTMAVQGAPALAEMQSTKPDTRDAAWTIMEKYILLGLIGTIAIPAVTGTVVTLPFVGAGAGAITYK